jgi:hypothetical protein
MEVSRGVYEIIRKVSRCQATILANSILVLKQMGFSDANDPRKTAATVYNLIEESYNTEIDPQNVWIPMQKMWPKYNNF